MVGKNDRLVAVKIAVESAVFEPVRMLADGCSVNQVHQFDPPAP